MSQGSLGTHASLSLKALLSALFSRPPPPTSPESRSKKHLSSSAPAHNPTKVLLQISLRSKAVLVFRRSARWKSLSFGGSTPFGLKKFTTNKNHTIIQEQPGSNKNLAAALTCRSTLTRAVSQCKCASVNPVKEQALGIQISIPASV